MTIELSKKKIEEPIIMINKKLLINNCEKCGNNCGNSCLKK